MSSASFFFTFWQPQTIPFSARLIDIITDFFFCKNVQHFSGRRYIITTTLTGLVKYPTYNYNIMTQTKIVVENKLTALAQIIIPLKTKQSQSHPMCHSIIRPTFSCCCFRVSRSAQRETIHSGHHLNTWLSQRTNIEGGYKYISFTKNWRQE